MEVIKHFLSHQTYLFGLEQQRDLNLNAYNPASVLLPVSGHKRVKNISGLFVILWLID